MQLTEHFSIEEMITSDTAIRFAIDNTPSAPQLANLKITAAGLELVRSLLGGKSIHVTSGYRCRELNSKVGGSVISAHMQGLAADIICPQFGTPFQICHAIVDAKLDYDQVIHEYGQWCHVAFPAAGNPARHLINTIRTAAKGYETGLNPIETRLALV